jgi:F-type H+-transporting ATPase subunit a
MYHWSWFYLIPGIEEGTLIPTALEASHGSIHVVPTAWFTLLLIVAGAFLANRGLAAARAKGGTLQYVPDSGLGLRNLAEIFTGGMINLVDGVLNDRKRTLSFLPLMGTLFIFILINNLLGVIPGFLPATSEISTNFAMATIVFVVFNIVGFQSQGMGYLKHMMGPVLGVAPLIFVLELIGIFVRPVSLSLRLFGNMNGDHTVFGVFSDLVPLVIPSLFLGLGVFVSFIQAFVFTLLSVVYVGLSVGHDDDHH